MKGAVLLLSLFGSMVYAQDFTKVISSNQELTKVNNQIEEKISTLKNDIGKYKAELLIKLSKEMEEEQGDYETILKTLNLFKIKHGKNIYAQEQIKINEKKLKEVREKHLEFKRKHSVLIEQLKHESFVPAEKKDMQEKVFYFEIKREEFREIFKINKERYDKTIDLAVERYTNDSKALVEEFKDLEFRRLK